MPDADTYNEWVTTTFLVNPTSFAKAATAATQPQPPAQAGPAPVDVFTQTVQKAIQMARIACADKEKLIEEMRVLDEMKQSKDNPDSYETVKDGQPATISKEAGDALRAKVGEHLLYTLENIRQWNHGILQTYEHAAPQSYGDFVASTTLGYLGVKDPGKQVNDLLDDASADLAGARADVGKFKYCRAAQLIAEAEEKGSQAEHLVSTWASKTQSTGAKTITVLQYTKKACFTVAKTIATAEFGKAGAAAIDAIETGAEVAGEALAGEEINWSEKVIDLGTNLLLDKYGKQAEDAVKGKIEKLAIEKLSRHMAADKAKALAEKVAAKLAPKIVSKGSDFVKGQVNHAAEKLKGKKVKWNEMMEVVVASMNNPQDKQAAALQSDVDKELAAA